MLPQFHFHWRGKTREGWGCGKHTAPVLVKLALAEEADDVGDDQVDALPFLLQMIGHFPCALELLEQNQMHMPSMHFFKLAGQASYGGCSQSW